MPPKFQPPKAIEINRSLDNACGEVIQRLQSLQGKHEIAVGLSGGVDSSLTAALLVEAGWEVEGLTLWLMKGQGSCCSDGLIDAAAICKQLGITHHVVDSRTTFQQQIIKKLIDGYQEGITPSPCSRCNRSVKFSEMLNWAQEKRQINKIATGHYARIRYSDEDYSIESISEKGKKRNKLLRGKDNKKDQSYFLYDLPQSILSNIIFPLGELTKEDTRKEALRYQLKTAKKPESQDLCLAEHYGSMKAFLDNYLPSREGEIVLKDGTVVGKHDGIEHFTIGQRKGLGIAWTEPLHVVALKADSNKVIVAPRAEAGQLKCIVGEINWLSISPPSESILVDVQIRYRSNPVLAKITPIEPHSIDIKNERPFRCKVEFKEEQFSISPGQAAVFYKGEVVLGGGIISNQLND